MLNLNKTAIESANNVSQFNAGDSLSREAEAVYADGISRMSAHAEDLNERQKTILENRLADWKNLVEKAYNDIISRRASWMPWTVCGPARYDAARNNQKAERQLQASVEWSRKMDTFIDNTLKILRDAYPLEHIIQLYRTGKRTDPIASDDPAAVQKLTARIEFLKEDQERMKLRNAHWRRHHSFTGFPGLSEEEAEKLDRSINDPNRLYHVPHPTYELQENLANIKRLEQRLKAILARKEAGDSEQVYNGFTIRQLAQEGFIHIILMRSLKHPPARS